MKSKDLQPRLIYPVKLLFKMEGERRSFPDKNKLKDCISTKSECKRFQRECFKKMKKERERNTGTKGEDDNE